MSSEQDFLARQGMQEGLSWLHKAEEAQIAAAREDVNAFIEYVGKDDTRKRADGTPASLIQYPIHEKMQRLMDRYKRLVLMTMPSSGKSTQLLLRALWLIGRNPDIRIVIISRNKKADGAGAKFATQIRSYIQNNIEIKKVFPHLHPGPKWEQTRFMVRRSTFRRDFTVQIAAPPTFFVGNRADLFLIDDFYDGFNTRTEADRKKTESWFWKVMDRLEPDGRVIMACNPWHPRDLAHNLERMMMIDPDNAPWHVERFTIYEPPDLDANLDEVVFTIPEFYDKARTLDIRNSGMPAAEFNRLYLCKAIDESESVFDVNKLEKLFRHPEKGGEGCDTILEITATEQAAHGFRVVVGVDLAARTHARADLTVISVVVVWLKEQVYQLVWQEGGRWRPDETAARVMAIDKRYRPTAIMVENNAAQDYIFQIFELLVENRRLLAQDDEAVPLPPVVPFTTTGKNKSDPTNGVESLSAEISRDIWLFPAITPDTPGPCHKDLAMLKDEMQSYSRKTSSGKKAHTGDHLMSLWLAREAARRLMYAEFEGEIEILDSAIRDEVDDAVSRRLESEDTDDEGDSVEIFGVGDDD